MQRESKKIDESKPSVRYQLSRAMKRLVAITSIGALLLPLTFSNAFADIGPYERVLILEITNMKTGEVKTKAWNFKGWTFLKPQIDVPDYTLKKIKRSFYTDTFSFSLSSESYEGQWMHFKLKMIQTPILVGRGFTTQFV
jgi:hypothetical protein